MNIATIEVDFRLRRSRHGRKALATSPEPDAIADAIVGSIPRVARLVVRRGMKNSDALRFIYATLADASGFLFTDRLYCIYRIGPLRWTRWRRMQHVQRIIVSPDKVAVYMAEKYPEFADLCHMVIDCGRTTATRYLWWAWSWELLLLRDDTRVTLRMAASQRRAELEAVARAIGRHFPHIKLEGLSEAKPATRSIGQAKRLPLPELPEDTVITWKREGNDAVIV